MKRKLVVFMSLCLICVNSHQVNEANFDANVCNWKTDKILEMRIINKLREHIMVKLGACIFVCYGKTSLKNDELIKVLLVSVLIVYKFIGVECKSLLPGKF